MTFQLNSLPEPVRNHIFDYVGPKQINRLKCAANSMKHLVEGYDSRATRGCRELFSRVDDLSTALSNEASLVQISMRGGCLVEEARCIVASPHQKSLSRLQITKTRGVRRTPSISLEALDQIATLQNLRELTLKGVKFAPSALAKFTQLTHLKFTHCRFEEKDLESTNILFKTVSQLTELRTLELMGNTESISDHSLTEERIAILSPLTLLETIRVGTINCIAMLALAKTFPNLRHLTGAVNPYNVFLEWQTNHLATTPPDLVRRLASLRFSEPDPRTPTSTFFSFFPYPDNRYEKMRQGVIETITGPPDTRDRLLETLQHGKFNGEDLHELLLRACVSNCHSNRVDIEMAKALVSAGADVNANYGQLLRNLVWNISHNPTQEKMELLSYLLTETDIDQNVVSKDEIPVLFRAIQDLKADIVSALLKAKVPPNLKMGIIQSPYIGMRQEGFFKDLSSVQILNPFQIAFVRVIWGASLSQEQFEKLKKIVDLLKEDFNINQRDSGQRTFLHWVASSLPIFAASLVKLLVSLGADVNARDGAGQTALDLLFEQYDSRSQHKIFFLVWLKTFDSFRSARATSSREFNWGKVLSDAIRLQIDPIPTGLWRLTAAKSSAIIAACMLGNKSELEKLIDTYSLKNPLNSTGKTVLHAAVEGGNVEIVQFLLDQGADIQAKTKDGTLPIDLAVDAQNGPVIVALATHESHHRREKLRF